MKSKPLYLLIYVGIWLLAIFPFPVSYTLSDFIYFWLYYVIGYRRKVVGISLKDSLPGKSAAELRVIEHKFYHYLCDYMLEDVKMLRIPEKEPCKRMTYENKETYFRMIDERGGIALLIPHYADFEWITGMGMITRSGDVPVQVYRPLEDVYLGGLFKHIRNRFGGYNVPRYSTACEVIRLRCGGKKIAIGLIIDQSPNTNETHHWTTFLNQDTVFMDDTERIAKMMNSLVPHCELRKEQRGYYRVEFDLVTDRPKETVDDEVAEASAHRLEQTIRREPAYWL